MSEINKHNYGMVDSAPSCALIIVGAFFLCLIAIIWICVRLGSLVLIGMALTLFLMWYLSDMPTIMIFGG